MSKVGGGIWYVEAGAHSASSFIGIDLMNKGILLANCMPIHKVASSAQCLNQVQGWT